MDPHQPNYYTNPAFCQQSEFHPPKRALSPQRSVRQSPVGAQTNHVVFDNNSLLVTECSADGIEEQEFYEEVIVDDHGFIKGKQVVVVAQNNEGQKYIQVPQEEQRKGGSRYGSTQQIHYNSPPKSQQKARYEYIPMQEQDPRLSLALARSPPKKALEEHVEVVPGVVHRYAVIEAEEETELTSKNERYALVPVNQLNNVMMVPPSQNNNNNNNNSRYDYPAALSARITPNQPNHSRYEYIQTTPPKVGGRYEYIRQQPTPTKPLMGRQNSSPRPGTNPVATQRLHELLSTPKKPYTTKVISPQSPRRLISPPLSPITKDPFQSSSPSRPPKAQQKLNYALASKHMGQQEKRLNTAIVPPICSSPVQSIYGETTTYSQKSAESWMNLSVKPNGHALAAAAFVMFLCGVITAGLSFYMLSLMGRPYYLDFSTVAGFTCAVMGLLGCRARNVYWLPNRNYLSGYLVLTVFSLLTCGGLLLLLLNDPRPGTPLADMTSAAVCGFSVLTLMLALTGVVSSYCCKYPPPDNRVQHCSPGLTV